MKKYISVLLILIAFAVLLSHSVKSAHLPPVKEGARIAVATDLHYLADRINDRDEYFMKMVENSDGKTTEYCREITEGLVNSVIELSPDALILAGDISFNGEKFSHEELAEILKRVKNAGIQVLVLPGNHDLYNERAYAFSGKYIYGVENINESTFEEIYWDYGYKRAFLRDEASLMLYPIRFGVVDVNEDGIFYQCQPVLLEDDKILERAWELLLKPKYLEKQDMEISDYTKWEKGYL